MSRAEVPRAATAREERPIEHSVECVCRAHSLVTQAAQCWNAGSIAAVHECVIILEQSAAELRAATAASRGRAACSWEFRNEILLMKKSVARLERLSDLAAAFLRSGVAPLGESPLYRPDGFAETRDAAAITIPGIRG